MKSSHFCFTSMFWYMNWISYNILRLILYIFCFFFSLLHYVFPYLNEIQHVWFVCIFQKMFSLAAHLIHTVSAQYCSTLWCAQPNVYRFNVSTQYITNVENILRKMLRTRARKQRKEREKKNARKKEKKKNENEYCWIGEIKPKNHLIFGVHSTTVTECITDSPTYYLLATGIFQFGCWVCTNCGYIICYGIYANGLNGWMDGWSAV